MTDSGVLPMTPLLLAEDRAMAVRLAVMSKRAYEAWAKTNEFKDWLGTRGLRRFGGKVLEDGWSEETRAVLSVVHLRFQLARGEASAAFGLMLAAAVCISAAVMLLVLWMGAPWPALVTAVAVCLWVVARLTYDVRAVLRRPSGIPLPVLAQLGDNDNK